MSSCWKCGVETPEGVTECEGCECGLSPLLREKIAEARLREVDWNKITTIEEFREFIRMTDWMMAISESHPHFASLKKFLK